MRRYLSKAMKDGRSKQHEDRNDSYFRKGHPGVKSPEERMCLASTGRRGQCSWSGVGEEVERMSASSGPDSSGTVHTRVFIDLFVSHIHTRYTPCIQRTGVVFSIPTLVFNICRLLKLSTYQFLFWFL